MARRLEALSKFRAILRAARQWEGPNHERQYIVNEARHQFRLHQHEHDPKRVDLLLLEAQCRLELALHYKIPYPRPSLVTPGNVGGEVVDGTYLPSLAVFAGQGMAEREKATLRRILTNQDLDHDSDGAEVDEDAHVAGY